MLRRNPLPIHWRNSEGKNQVPREAFRTLRIKIAEINTRFSETIGGIKIVQLFLQEKNNYIKFKNLNREHYLAGMKQIRVFAVFMPVIELFGAVALAVVIYYGGRGVLAESISLGALVAFISYIEVYLVWNTQYTQALLAAGTLLPPPLQSSYNTLSEWFGSDRKLSDHTWSH